MNIPVFHDDQHGTAIISRRGAAERARARRQEDRRGQGGLQRRRRRGHRLRQALRHARRASARTSCSCDTKGVIYKGRTEGMNPYKEHFAADTDARTLADALRGRRRVRRRLGRRASSRRRWCKTMADEPDRLRDGQPRPGDHLRRGAWRRAPTSSWPPAARTTRTRSTTSSASRSSSAARSTCGATAINEEMKLAAAQALAALAKEDVPDAVLKAYGGKPFEFGREYIIPKPFDSARAALGGAGGGRGGDGDRRGPQAASEDLEAYRDALEARLGRSREVMRIVVHKAQHAPKRIVFPEGEDEKILRAAQDPRRRGDRASRSCSAAGRGSGSALRRARARPRGAGRGHRPGRRPEARRATSTTYYELRRRKGVTREDDAERACRTHNVLRHA